jgi:hypothetical protein
MAIALVPSSATITANKGGSKADIFIGSEHALLHCTTKVRRAAANEVAGHPGHTGPMITCTGTVLMSGDPASPQDKIALASWEFGMILVADIVVYEALYAGRMDNEGSITVNLKAAFGTNPSLDGDGDLPTVDEMIFDPGNLVITPQTTGTKGFLVTYKLGDHPNNPFPLRQTNSKKHSPNFLHTARRDEGFIAYFVAREPGGKVHHLARIGWHIIWHGTLSWTSPTATPTVAMVTSRIDIGQPTTDSVDNTSFPRSAAIAKNPQRPTCNEQDATAFDRGYGNGASAPVRLESETRPSNLPSKFFPSP